MASGQVIQNLDSGYGMGLSFEDGILFSNTVDGEIKLWDMRSGASSVLENPSKVIDIKSLENSSIRSIAQMDVKGSTIAVVGSTDKGASGLAILKLD